MSDFQVGDRVRFVGKTENPHYIPAVVGVGTIVKIRQQRNPKGSGTHERCAVDFGASVYQLGTKNLVKEEV